MTKQVSIRIPRYPIPMSGSMLRREPEDQEQRARADRVPVHTVPVRAPARVPAPVRAAAEQAALRRISIGPDLS